MNIHILKSVRGEVRENLIRKLRKDDGDPNCKTKDRDNLVHNLDCEEIEKADFVIGMIDDYCLIRDVPHIEKRIALSRQPPERPKSFVQVAHPDTLMCYGVVFLYLHGFIDNQEIAKKHMV